MNARRLRILQMAAMVDAEQAQEDILLAQWYMRRNRRQRRRRHLGCREDSSLASMIP